MPDEVEFIEELPTLEVRNDIAFLHIDAQEFAMRPNTAIRFLEGAFRNVANWLAGRAGD